MYVLELAGQDDRFAAAEAANAASPVEVRGAGLAVARAITPRRVRGLAYTRRASRLLGQTAASVEEARQFLETVDIDRDGSAAVRARDVRGTAGIDTQYAERALGSVLTTRGIEIDLDSPRHELRALFAGDICMLAWLLVESVRDFGERAPTDKPFFQPGSMGPMEARAVANLAGAGPGKTVVDPMCGTGGILVEAGLIGARVVGLDAQSRMVRGAAANLGHYLDEPVNVFHGDASLLPICGTIDAVVFDAPYGRQSKIAGQDPASLIAAALVDTKPITDRTVVVSNQPMEAAMGEVGWRVRDVFERPVHRSLTRYVHVLTAPGQ